jgi:chromosome partitioning protein
MKTLVVANQKGGVGKTAILVHVAFDFADRGLRVLVIDLDTQGNASYTLRNRTIAGDASSLFTPNAKQVVGAPGITLYRADSALADIEKHDLQGAASHLRSNIKRLAEDFDVCLIDTAPALGVRLVAALFSADFVVSPIELEAYSLQGIRMMVATIGNVKRSNPSLKFLGILPSKVDSRNPRHTLHLCELQKAYPSDILPTVIGLRSSVADALANGQPVWTNPKTAARKATKEMRAVASYLYNIMILTSVTSTL